MAEMLYLHKAGLENFFLEIVFNSFFTESPII